MARGDQGQRVDTKSAEKISQMYKLTYGGFRVERRPFWIFTFLFLEQKFFKYFFWIPRPRKHMARHQEIDSSPYAGRDRFV